MRIRKVLVLTVTSASFALSPLEAERSFSTDQIHRIVEANATASDRLIPYEGEEIDGGCIGLPPITYPFGVITVPPSEVAFATFQEKEKRLYALYTTHEGFQFSGPIGEDPVLFNKDSIPAKNVRYIAFGVPEERFSEANIVEIQLYGGAALPVIILDSSFKVTDGWTEKTIPYQDLVAVKCDGGIYGCVIDKGKESTLDTQYVLDEAIKARLPQTQDLVTIPWEMVRGIVKRDNLTAFQRTKRSEITRDLTYLFSLEEISDIAEVQDKKPKMDLEKANQLINTQIREKIDRMSKLYAENRVNSTLSKWKIVDGKCSILSEKCREYLQRYRTKEREPNIYLKSVVDNLNGQFLQAYRSKVLQKTPSEKTTRSSENLYLRSLVDSLNTHILDGFQVKKAAKSKIVSSSPQEGPLPITLDEYFDAEPLTYYEYVGEDTSEPAIEEQPYFFPEDVGFEGEVAEQETITYREVPPPRYEKREAPRKRFIVKEEIKPYETVKKDIKPLVSSSTYIPPVKKLVAQPEKDNLNFYPTKKKPSYRIEEQGFHIDSHEVSNAEYAQFLKATRRRAPPHWQNGEIPKGMEKAPVVNISYYDALSYAEWAGKRLPTQSEWNRARDLIDPSVASYLYIYRGAQGFKGADQISWSNPKVSTRKAVSNENSRNPLHNRFNSSTGIRCVRD